MKKDNLISHKLKVGWQASVAAVLFMVSAVASAALPTAVNSSSGAASGNFVAWLQGWTADLSDYAGLFVSTVGFIWVSWILLSKFNEARQTKDPDWGSVGLTAVIAGGMLVIVSFFLNEATGVI